MYLISQGIHLGQLCLVLFQGYLVYMDLETLWRIWQWFSCWGHMSIMCLYVHISSPQGQDMLSKKNWGSVVVFKVAVTCSALNKTAKDFSLVAQGFKMGGCSLQGYIIHLELISLFLFGKHIFMCLMACQSGCNIKLALEFCSFFH